MKNKLQEDIGFLRKLTFSDEANFSLDGCVNNHNTVYWSVENPHVRLNTKVHTSRSLTVWAVVSCRGLIDYEILDATVNSEIYGRIFNDKVVPFLTNPLHNQMIYQQDGAPAHFAASSRQILDEKLGERWIGRGGPVEWPARSPDLTVCDFFLWPYLKDKVYETNFHFDSLIQLQQKIKFEIESIPSCFFTKAFKNFQKRINLCVEANGSYFE